MSDPRPTSCAEAVVRRSAITLLVLLALAGCGGPNGRPVAQRAEGGSAGRGAGRPCGTAKPPKVWRHVIWIWMENNSYGQVVGNRSAPYLNGLARRCGLATNYQGVAHPSLPNYIAATSGDPWGIGDDGPPSEHRVSRRSIFGQVAGAGKTWRSYEESMPRNCDRESSGLYAVKHNPAAYYTGDERRCLRWDVPLGTTSSGNLISDLRHDRLPEFAFVTPNLCDDMHNCGVAAGDAWLARWVPRIVSSSGYRSGGTVLVITFDEGEGGSDQVATIVVSPSTNPGTVSAVSFTHYSLLKTTEELLHLRVLGQARLAASMRRAFGLG